MIYTSAIYANAEHTAVTGTDTNGATETVAADHVIFRLPNDGPVGFVANGGVIGDYVEPTVSTAYQLYKSTLIRRLDEEKGEAVTLKSLLDAAPVKSQMLWAASEWLGSDDPLFLTLRAAIGQALGASRAAEILAPE